MSDRTEQAKALIAESEGFDPHPRSAGGKNHTTQYAVLLVERLAAALTASEAEVTRQTERANDNYRSAVRHSDDLEVAQETITRLETGIAEALKDAVEIVRSQSGLSADVAADYLEEVGLSQPTTDTNGAHA